MIFVRHLMWKPFINKTHHPQKIQNELLKEILKGNENTYYGKLHNFSGIKDYNEFCSQIPVQSFEDLREFIEKQENTREPLLNKYAPVMYTLTSGTTGKPKYIPLHSNTIKQFKKNHKIFSYAQYSSMPDIYSGSILAIASPAVEGYLETGTPYGSMSGLVYSDIPRIIKHKYVIPPEVFDIENYDLKYLLISALGLSDENITLLASANPSTLLKISEIINSRFDELIYMIENGDLKDKSTSKYECKEILKKYLKKNKGRVSRLNDISKDGKKILFKDIWPNLQAVVTWTSGSCSVLLPLIEDHLPENTHILEMGYFSSEFRGNLIVDSIKNRGVPTFTENFFEFVEKDNWENNNQNFLRLDQIVEGKQYYIIVTTQDGLYRYFINDIIEVTGKYNNTSTIKFVQKGKGVTNITGEKLYESQLLEAIKLVAKDWEIKTEFFVMVADQENLQYTLYIEREPIKDFDFSSFVERILDDLNIEYKVKRESGRLKPLKTVFIKPGTGDLYKKFCVDSGQRENQFKFVYLQYEKDCSFDFSQFAYS